jgi:Secretion system C-terminal sorting domain
VRSGVFHPEKDRRILLFPNPTTGLLTLEFKDATPKAGSIQILDLLGRILLHEPLLPGNLTYEFSLDKLPSGVYFVKVLEGGDAVWVQKVVKQ